MEHFDGYFFPVIHILSLAVEAEKILIQFAGTIIAPAAFLLSVTAKEKLTKEKRFMPLVIFG